MKGKLPEVGRLTESMVWGVLNIFIFFLILFLWNNIGYILAMFNIYNVEKIKVVACPQHTTLKYIRT